MKNKVIQLGSIANQVNSYRENPNRGRVYDKNGVCPSLTCMGGGGLQPHVIVRGENDTDNSSE